MVSLISAIGSSLFVSGTLPFFKHNTSSDGHGSVPEAQAARLPLHVIEHFGEKQMVGDAATGSNLKVDDEFVDPENHCEFCTRVEYIPGSRGLAGFAYSSDSALDLTGAKKIRFWVMGEDGGEKIKFKIAGKKKDSDDRQGKDSLSIFSTEIFGRTSKEVSLRDDWTKYEVDLIGADLNDITHPFGFELSKGNGEKSQVVYIKGVIFDEELVESQNVLTTVAEELGDEAGMSVKIHSNGTEGDTSTLFRFSSNVSGGEKPYEYQWNFDDGDQMRTRNAAHTFGAPGSYNVSLSVTDNAGKQVTSSITIEIDEEATEEQEDNPERISPRETEEQSENSTSLMAQKSD
jgi:hypothetical protein